MFQNQNTTPGLDQVIDDTIAETKLYLPGTPEYQATVDTLVKLYELKAQNAPPRISPDMIASIAANLLGIGIIVGYERMNIVTTKALNFVTRLK